MASHRTHPTRSPPRVRACRPDDAAGDDAVQPDGDAEHPICDRAAALQGRAQHGRWGWGWRGAVGVHFHSLSPTVYIAGYLYVASNTYEQADALGIQHGGRLARWNGNMSSQWEILEETAFFEITGRLNMGCVVFAVGELRRIALVARCDAVAVMVVALCGAWLWMCVCHVIAVATSGAGLCHAAGRAWRASSSVGLLNAVPVPRVGVRCEVAGGEWL